MQEVILGLIIVVIIFTLIKFRLKRNQREERIREIVYSGIPVAGYVSATKQKTSFDHERNRNNSRKLELRLHYHDPVTGQEITTVYFCDHWTPYVHPYILAANSYNAGEGIADIRRILKSQREQLQKQGLQGKDLKEAMMEFAKHLTAKSEGYIDDQGYKVFQHRIPVTVYVSPSQGETDRNIHVKFLYNPATGSSLAENI